MKERMIKQDRYSDDLVFGDYFDLTEWLEYVNNTKLDKIQRERDEKINKILN